LQTFGYGINDLHQIVGTYEDSNGTYHGFLAEEESQSTVPEPATLLLFGAGLLTLKVRMRRS